MENENMIPINVCDFNYYPLQPKISKSFAKKYCIKKLTILTFQYNINYFFSKYNSN